MKLRDTTQVEVLTFDLSDDSAADVAASINAYLGNGWRIVKMFQPDQYMTVVLGI